MIAVTNELRRSIARGNSGQAGLGDGVGAGSSRQDGPRPAGFGSGFLATPDASDMADGGANRQLSSRPRTLQLDRSRHSSEQSTAQDEDSTSPVPSESQTIFGSNVATPPITDADVEPFADDDLLRMSSRSILHPRPSVDVVAAQDASLPSPRLSPTLVAAQLHSNDEEPESQERADYQVESANQNGWADDSQMTEDAEGMALVRAGVQSSDSQALERRPRISDDNSVVVDPHMLLEAFDSMKPEMQTYMMYQFLRRCARPTLRIVANAVNPALKCDFFFQLPLELSYHVLSYLDHRDLCRAAQVSRHWRNIVDRNETGWRELFDRDGYKLPPGELIKAINQGWGWQDPVGAMGFERDLSMHSRLTSSEHDLTRSLRTDAAPRLRTSKRKRGLTTYSASERSKRRASVLETASVAQTEVRQHKSAGPLSAANAAATAVPNPNLGLPSLRQLHLYKSLYRRHHMMRESWTSGEVKPAHVAFAAHPRHVITCLQFDDDKIITGSDDTFIHVYDTKTGKLRKKLAGHEGGVWALQYEGNILVSGSTDRSVRVWDIEAGLCQQVFYGHTSTVRCLQILTPVETGKDSAGKPIMQPEKPLIITGSRDSFLRVWRLPEVGSKRYYQAGLPAQESECPYFIRALSGHTHSVRAISAHGDTLVSGSYDSVVRVWRISTGECLHVLHGHTQKVYSVVLDHERNRCISGSMDSLVKIWDLATGACLFTLEGHNLLVGLLDLRDERLVSAAADSTLRIWDPETGRCKNTLMAHTGAITCFQHDGQKVISGSEKTVKMWDVKTGECIQDLLTDLSGVWQVKFDGRRCVAAVQREQLTYVEILDFGAVRDGQPPEELGRRILLDGEEVQAIIEEDA
jgi:F-box and WD-40 domain protein CDC4